MDSVQAGKSSICVIKLSFPWFSAHNLGDVLQALFGWFYFDDSPNDDFCEGEHYNAVLR